MKRITTLVTLVLVLSAFAASLFAIPSLNKVYNVSSSGIFFDRDRTSIMRSGAACNGITDDTRRINRFLMGLPAGSTVVIPPERFCLIGSGDLSVPASIAIVGSGNPFPAGTEAPGKPTGSGFILNPSYTISLGGAATLKNLGVWREGLKASPTAAEVIRAVAAWGADDSVGIYVPPNLGGEIIDHVFVEGFNQGILIESGRVTVHLVLGDDYNGLMVGYYPGDHLTLSNIEFEPYYSFGKKGASGAWARPGVAFWLIGTNGGGPAYDLFSFMWANGLILQGSGWAIHGSWFEWQNYLGNGQTDAIGIRAIDTTGNWITDTTAESDQPVMEEAGAQDQYSSVETVGYHTGYPDYYLGGSDDGITLTVGRAVAAGNQIRASIASGSISGSPVSVTVTAPRGGWTAQQAAVAFAKACDANDALATAHIECLGRSTTGVVNVYYVYPETVTVTPAATGTAIFTRSSNSGIGAPYGEIQGAKWYGSSSSVVFQFGVNSQGWTIASPSFVGKLPERWISTGSPGIGSIKLSGIHWSRTSASNLSGAGQSPSISGGANDGDGTVTEGSGATGFTLTFTTPFYKAPDCILSSPTGTTLTRYTSSSRALKVVNRPGSGQQWTYHCRPN